MSLAGNVSLNLFQCFLEGFSHGLCSIQIPHYYTQ
jgi:hypothetical protein